MKTFVLGCGILVSSQICFAQTPDENFLNGANKTKLGSAILNYSGEHSGVAFDQWKKILVAELYADQQNPKPQEVVSDIGAQPAPFTAGESSNTNSAGSGADLNNTTNDGIAPHIPH